MKSITQMLYFFERNNYMCYFLVNKFLPLNIILYPPFLNLMNILIYGKNKLNVGKLSKEIYNIIGRDIHNMYGENYRNHIIGPNPAPIEKIKDNYRYQIILKISDDHIDIFKDIVKRVCIYNEHKLNMTDIRISIDINPVNIL